MYVIMKLVHYIEDEKDQIFVEILNTLMSLSQNMNGVKVINEMLNVLKSPECRKMIIGKILEDPIKFMEDMYSNYAFQYIIANWDFSITKPLFEKAISNVTYLSTQKYASNSIESVLVHAPFKFFDIYIREIKDDILSTLFD
jgi:hypothetical protein